jgi:hypothetical protein
VTETFTYRGPSADQSVIVPGGASVADVRIIGGKGGGAKSGDTYITGGDGALVTGKIAVTAGQTLRLRVAGFGGDADGNRNPGAGGWGATGYGGRGGGSSRGDGGGGGGASSIEIGTPAVRVAVAGGGGGAGGMGFAGGSDAGGPGGSTGVTVDPGHNGKGIGAGKGGGGAANGVPAGGGGGNGSNLGGAGGGGGAGLIGGGGGGGGGTGGGGGGGGGAASSDVTSLLTASSVVRGVTSDGNGLIVITWNTVSAPVCFGQDVQVPLNSLGVPVQLHCSDTSRPTSFRIVALPDHGTLVNRDLTTGTFTYVPDAGYVGTDSMMYQALTGDRASVPYTVTFIIAAPLAQMTLTASPTAVVLGRAPVLTVRMPANATGHVGFYDSDQPGADKGIGTAPIVDGVATLTMPTKELGVGTHSIHASYGGDASYAPSESNVVVITVSAGARSG